MPAGLWQVAPALTGNQANDQVVDRGEVLSLVWVADAGGIFVQRLIAPVMQAIFDAPILPDEAQQALGTGLVGRQAGEPVDDFMAHLAGQSADRAAFQLEDLSHTRPIEILIEQAGGRDGALLVAAMPLVDGACALEVFRSWAKPLDVGFRVEPLLDVGAQGRLIVLRQPFV